MANDSSAYSHQEWIGYVQPVGVVVSTSALIQAGAAINRNFIPLHKSFLGVLPQDRDANPIPELSQFPRFAVEVLGWRSEDLTPPDDSLTIPISGYEDVLRPNYVVKDGSATLLLISVVNSEFDADPVPEPRHWNAAPQMRFERLLRETGTPAGLLVSQTAIRLVYAPKGESSGHITFKIADMVQVAGRPILAALHMLVSADRLFTLAEDQRLPALLAISRRHQNLVSTLLSGQVMETLFDLLRGFQGAHDQTQVLREVLQNDPHQVYAGLLTVLLRLVFVLYAEDRGLLSSEETYLNSYSIGGLFERLREDQAQHPDTMDQRYGAWAQLLTLFRLVYRGAQHGKIRIPGRKGYLFDPDCYPFLEGRPNANAEQIQIPRVPDGVLYRVLTRLLILNGERLSYRNLDVEQIGSVYEAMMGFELHIAQGPSIAIKPKKRNGAPVTINLAELLALASAKRNEWLNKTTDQKLTGQSERALKRADSIEDLIAALDRRIAKTVTPTVVPSGSMIFQPSLERRRTGSHYTPRSLTQPIVEAVLTPIVNSLGDRPRPDQILALKICDPAMGSGAFLVEACRQLGDSLVKAWGDHSEAPPLLPDEDEVLHARRLVAQRCLYGVDRNEMATDLAKLSLWLATLARDHEFTFLNHSLRHGDSLVGLTAVQIAAFDWEPHPALSFLETEMRERIGRATQYRKRILDAQEGTPYAQLSQQLDLAEQALHIGRMAGDLIVAAFFEGDKRASRANARIKYESEFRQFLSGKGNVEVGIKLDQMIRKLRDQQRSIPFHWHLEFPEVFDLDEQLRARGGFDGIVGNPPFAGGKTLQERSGDGYVDWIKMLHEQSHGNADLVAHFFRRAFDHVARKGCFGLIATNTIGQGDTRSTGLRYICTHGGVIYKTRKRLRWPGEAAVIVSVIHVSKRDIGLTPMLDGRPVNEITAFLFYAGGHEDPARLPENKKSGFIGNVVLGMGFTFDDQSRDGVAASLSEMKTLIASSPSNAERIFPFLGGEELNNNPKHDHHRFVINFENFPLRRESVTPPWIDASKEEQKHFLSAGIVPLDYPGPVAADWPALLEIVQTRVKPERSKSNREKYSRVWWQFAERAVDLTEQIRVKGLKQVLAVNCGATPHVAFAMQPTGRIFSHTLALFTKSDFAAFCVLQSRPHEIWARFMASSMKDDLRYTPSDCFETFPFPDCPGMSQKLEETGEAYYRFRAELMERNKEGLTKTYNRFHRPDEQSEDFNRLRRLHSAMDRMVLDSYGWSDASPICQFFPEFDEDQEEDEDDARPRQRKYRYRWPEDGHDEILANLLALNRQRAGLPAAPEQAAEKRQRPTAKSKTQPGLF